MELNVDDDKDAKNDILNDNKEDYSIAPKVLPKAGKQRLIMGGIIIIFVICSVRLYIKLRMYKDIK